MADSSASVMIVDDEEMVARSLRSFLELETSYDVHTFTSPERALDQAGDLDLNVVIADFMMPSMDGITFLQHLRDQQPQATRMLLTGYADKENAIRAINEAGLYYYLEKPWNNEHLKLVIRNGVERSTLFAELDSRVRDLEGANRELTDIRKRLVQTFL